MQGLGSHEVSRYLMKMCLLWAPHLLCVRLGSSHLGACHSAAQAQKSEISAQQRYQSETGVCRCSMYPTAVHRRGLLKTEKSHQSSHTKTAT